MESAKSANEYTLMLAYDFNKPINAEVIFDSDEDDLKPVVPENQDNGHKKASKPLDMPCIDEHNTTTENHLDNLITWVIKKYVCETKNPCDKNPPKRKSSTKCDKIKNKVKRQTNPMKEIKNQHSDNKASSRSSNDQNNCKLASFSTDLSGSLNNVSKDIRSQNNCNSNPLTNTTNGQPKSIEPKSKHVEESIPSIDLSEEISSQRNTDNSQTISICADQLTDPLKDSWTLLNIVSDGIGNPLDTNSTSSSPPNAYNGPPKYARIEVKAEIVKDSNPQNNSSNEITNQQHIFITSNLSPNTDNGQSLSACIEPRVGNSEISANVSEEISNDIDKIGDQRNTSGIHENTDSSYTFTNVSKVICDQLNNSSSSLPTYTTVSTDVNSNIQTQQNSDDFVTYDHLKPLLDTVSEHLVLIWNRLHSCNDFLKDRCVENVEFNEELRKKLYKYKIRLFDLSYSTVVNIILPRANNKTFVKNFIDNTVALSKSENRETTKGISILYLEMIHWAQKMKRQIASESVFDHEIMSQSLAPTATNTTGLPEIVQESINPHIAHNSIRPLETERPPPWIARSNPPPPYTNNPAPLHTINLPLSYSKYPPSSPYTSNIHPQYMNAMPPQTYIRAMNNSQVSTKPTQNKKGRSNVNVSSNPTGGTYHYQSTYFPTLPNPNQAQSVYYTNNNLSSNNNSYSAVATAESEYQKFLRTPRNLPPKNRSNQNQNQSRRPNDASTQGINHYNNNGCLNQANSNQQESDRSSISRDSGFYSPRDFEQEPSTSPLITHVTSLNPDAVNIIKGSCFVCGKHTNKKCVGCYAVYYCSYGCQNFHWRNHIAYCNTNQEIRRLLSK